METHVLGGLSMQLASGTVRLGTPKQQAVLAMLVTQPQQLVTVEQLVAVELLADQWMLKQHEQAVPLLRGLLGSDPLRESAHLLLMRALSDVAYRFLIAGPRGVLRVRRSGEVLTSLRKRAARNGHVVPER